MIKKIIIKLNY